MAAKADTPPRGMLSSIERANEIKKDQGFHECEISTSGEADLHQHLKNCTKNPGHKDFIPVTKFNIGHLPPVYQDIDLLNLIRVIINQTVSVCVKYTSFDRVETFPGQDEPYPFYHHHGSDCLRMGTGMVNYVNIYTKEKARKESKTCQCEQCKDSPTPKPVWCEIDINTARHIVFDDAEAKHTTCQLFYDSDEEKNKIQELQVSRMESHKKIDYDHCLLTCYTHDLELGKKMKELHQLYLELSIKVHSKSKMSVIERPLVVIVSHPHGCSKQVTIGEMTHREMRGRAGYDFQEEDGPTKRKTWMYDVTRYKYTAPTCPGSSGANITIYGRFGVLSHPHSQRCETDGINMSGVFCEPDIDCVL